MKKTQTFVLAIGIMLMAAACKNDVHRFVTSDGTHRLEAEYSGKIVFNDDGSVNSMSKQSYFKVDRNGQHVVLKCNIAGKITYINNEGEELSTPDAEDKALLAAGIRLINNTRKGAWRQ